MLLRSPTAPVLFLAFGALTTAAAAQSAQQPRSQILLGPAAQFSASPQGNVAAAEPQFHLQLPAGAPQPRILRPHMSFLIAESKCFTLRSYHFAPSQASEPPQLQSYSTCTPATSGELHPTSEPPIPNR